MNYWPYKIIKVSSLRLDDRNPRLTRDGKYDSPRDIIQYLFEHEDTMQVAQSIATRGFFSSEPLLAVKQENAFVVLEGNRRLAALKSLLNPDLLEGPSHRAIEKLATKAAGRDLTSVPVVVAPNRRLTDKLLAGRHIGTSVKAWDAANRAAFILEKIEEGYEPHELRDELGFSDADIRSAKQTDAIAKLIKSAPIPAEVRGRIDNPNSKVLSTVERLVDSTVGRKLIMLEPDSEHGVRGTTTKEEFLKGFVRLLTDIATGKASSRTLNSGEDMEKYYTNLGEDRPKKKKGGFSPADIINAEDKGKKRVAAGATPAAKRSKSANKWVVPKSFKVLTGAERLVVIRDELTKLERAKFPNAGSVLLRVFLELSMVDYLDRSGQLGPLVDRLKSKSPNAVKNGVPVMRELRKEFTQIAKSKLKSAEALSVEKALRKDESAPFGVDDMHSFVHQLHEFPGDKEINTFWNRMQPLFSLMLEDSGEGE
jgi:hypothetical protein